MSSVWVRLSMLFQLSVITLCGAVCFKFTHLPCDYWENIYTLSYFHHQIRRMNYYPLFRLRSWNNGICCMSFYILIISTITLRTHNAFITSLLRHDDATKSFWRYNYISLASFVPWAYEWYHQNLQITLIKIPFDLEEQWLWSSRLYSRLNSKNSLVNGLPLYENDGLPISRWMITGNAE